MIELMHGKCQEILPTLADKSIDAIFTDPPYPEVKRDYGTLTTDEWFHLMYSVVKEGRRILKPHGSMCMILQPNSSKVGNLRPWLFEFAVWCAKEWNIVQDVWWWNPSTPPNVHCQRKYGLCRPSVKMCLWLGDADCYRNQDEVLLPLKDHPKSTNNDLERKPSGQTMRRARCLNTCFERGGATPFNMLSPIH
jgi:DNA modification methylase